MIERLRGRLTYANVMSTLAVFLAVGGGVTLAAISGSGSAKFGATKQLEVAKWVTVLNLPQVGKIQIYCSKGSTLGYRNTSGKRQQLTSLWNETGNSNNAPVDPGDRLNVGGFAANDDGLDTARLHVFRPGRPPIAEITVSHRYSGGSCDGRSAVAQALWSE